MTTCERPEDISKSMISSSLAYAPDIRSARSLDQMSARENLEDAPAKGPERALAEGVLGQATADLRRFQDSPDAIGREMYSDAKSWFISNDGEWPYSFVNVCRTLGLSPEAILDEVFAAATADWYSHSRRVAGRVARSVKGSLSNMFAARRTETLVLAKS